MIVATIMIVRVSLLLSSCSCPLSLLSLSLSSFLPLSPCYPSLSLPFFTYSLNPWMICVVKNIQQGRERRERKEVIENNLANNLERERERKGEKKRGRERKREENVRYNLCSSCLHLIDKLLLPFLVPSVVSAILLNHSFSLFRTCSVLRDLSHASDLSADFSSSFFFLSSLFHLFSKPRRTSFAFIEQVSKWELERGSEN